MWWNSSYKFRRKMRISADYGSISPGTVLIFPFNTEGIFDLGKVRSDYQDIEVIHQSTISNDFTVLPKNVDDNNVNFIIDIALPIEASNEDGFFVYYGNPNLTNAFSDIGNSLTTLSPPRIVTKIPSPIILTGNTILTSPLIVSPIRLKSKISYPNIIKPVQRNVFNSDFWSNHLFPSSNKIAYTKPGVHWVGGVGLVKGARATVTFASDRIRMVCTMANNQGIAHIRIDEDDWEEVNLFNHTSVGEVTIFTKEGLEPKEHTLQLVVSGDKSPDSSGYGINFLRFETLDVAKLENLGEEVNPDLVWTSVFGGAI